MNTAMSVTLLFSVFFTVFSGAMFYYKVQHQMKFGDRINKKEFDKNVKITILLIITFSSSFTATVLLLLQATGACSH